MNDKLRKGLSLTLFILGIIVFSTALTNVTGAVIGAPQITSGISSLIGIVLIFAALMVFSNRLDNSEISDVLKDEGAPSSESMIDRIKRPRDGTRNNNRYSNKEADFVFGQIYKHEYGKKPNRRQLKEFRKPYHEKEEIAEIVNAYKSDKTKNKEDFYKSGIWKR